MRIRCYATLARRLPASETDAPQPKFYTSDYVGLLIVRDDGTVTGPQPGQPEPDCKLKEIVNKEDLCILRCLIILLFILVQGKFFEITVEGLHPNGDLKSLPGEDAELTCVITGKKILLPSLLVHLLFCLSNHHVSSLKTKERTKGSQAIEPSTTGVFFDLTDRNSPTVKWLMKYSTLEIVCY